MAKFKKGITVTIRMNEDGVWQPAVVEYKIVSSEDAYLQKSANLVYSYDEKDTLESILAAIDAEVKAVEGAEDEVKQ